MSDDDTPVTDHTPETPPVPAEAPPATPHAEGDDLRTIVHKLEESVNALTERVELLTPDPRDSQPTKRPWTHRFGSGN